VDQSLTWRSADTPPFTTLTLNNGVTMPALGLGVFQTPPEETRDAVTAALQAGYRHIDTAAAYGNERQVGEAIRNSGVDRSEVFLETKIWISDYGYDQTLHGFDKSARKLGVDQIDLLILHQALPSQFELTLEAYRALETLLGDGKVRAIEVSTLGAPGGMSRRRRTLAAAAGAATCARHAIRKAPDLNRVHRVNLRPDRLFSI
jgi:diketogulonate reductase-like aldo/keto reductase